MAFVDGILIQEDNIWFSSTLYFDSHEPVPPQTPQLQTDGNEGNFLSSRPGHGFEKEQMCSDDVMKNKVSKSMWNLRWNCSKTDIINSNDYTVCDICKSQMI